MAAPLSDRARVADIGGEITAVRRLINWPQASGAASCFWRDKELTSDDTWRAALAWSPQTRTTRSTGCGFPHQAPSCLCAAPGLCLRHGDARTSSPMISPSMCLSRSRLRTSPMVCDCSMARRPTGLGSKRCSSAGAAPWPASRLCIRLVRISSASRTTGLRCSAVTLGSRFFRSGCEARSFGLQALRGTSRRRTREPARQAAS